MQSAALKPVLENLDQALARLETEVEKRLQVTPTKETKQKKAEPQLDLYARHEREINRKIAAKLDQTISRLETLLIEE